ncbi:hypothetical protein AAHC03_09793 [Spirometra sp. Aus1]
MDFDCCRDPRIVRRLKAVITSHSQNETEEKRPPNSRKTLTSNAVLKTSHVENAAEAVKEKPTETKKSAPPATKDEVEIQLANFSVVLPVLPDLLFPVEPHLSDKFAHLSPALLLTALRYAVSEGNVDEVINLLSLPTPPDLKVLTEPRILSIAARKGFADILGILLRHGAEVDARSQSGSTALLAAADTGHFMAMAVLLQWGANVNATNLKNDTALLRAIRRGFLPCVELLISYGANPIPAVRPGMTNVLLPIQLARHTQQPEMQAILVTAIQRIEKYMLGLVKASLPSNAFLIDPGHMHHQDSVTPRSLSFFPVQLISLVDATSFVFTFTTPPLYSEFFATDETQTTISNAEVEWIPDELILLYLLRVNLVEGSLTPPRDGSLPTLTEVNFNGMANRSELMKPDPSSGFRVYVLGSRLNNGGLNTLTLETPFSASQHAAAQPKVRRRNLYTWRAPAHQSAPKDELPAPNEKILVGAYRVRMGAAAFAQSPPRPGSLCDSDLTSCKVDTTTDHSA